MRKTTITCDRTGLRAESTSYDSDVDHDSPLGWAAITVTVARKNPAHAEAVAARKSYDDIVAARVAAQMDAVKAEHEKTQPQIPWGPEVAAQYAQVLEGQAEAEVGERPDPDEIPTVVFDVVSYDLSPGSVPGLIKYVTAGGETA